MIKVGITGGIGAGKSTVSKYLEHLSFPVFNSDLVSREILMTDKSIHQSIKERWGGQVIINGEINRVEIAKIVFSNEEELTFLNHLLHPKVASSFDSFCKESDSPIVFKEAAIMFESGAYKLMDKLLNVHCDERIRIQRVISRDQVNEQEVKNRIARQWTDAQRKEASDFTIVNNGDNMLIPQIQEVLKSLI
jgi:dephospho-CoA kinase